MGLLHQRPPAAAKSDVVDSNYAVLPAHERLQKASAIRWEHVKAEFERARAAAEKRDRPARAAYAGAGRHILCPVVRWSAAYIGTDGQRLR